MKIPTIGPGKAAATAVLCLLAGCAGPPPGEADCAFEGAEAISAGELRREIHHDLERYAKDPRDTVLDDAAFRISSLYRLEGYPWVEVHHQISAGSVVFVIREGDHVLLGRVHFRGNDAVSEEEFKAFRPEGLLGTSQPYSHRLVDGIVVEVLAAYGARGYVDAAIAEPAERYDADDKSMHVTLEITEGMRYEVAGFRGLPDAPDLKNALDLWIGKPFTRGTADAVSVTIFDYYRDRGRPFVQVGVVPQPDRATGLVALDLEVDPGPAAHVAGFRVSGNERTRESFILQRADLQEGREYRARDLRRAVERLHATGLFRSARVAAGPFDPATGDLLLDVGVEETESGELSVRAGHGTLDGAHVGADVSYRNAFGGAEIFRIGGTLSQIGVRAEAEAALPYFLGTELRPDATVYYEHRNFPSFEVVSTGTVGALQFPVSEHVHGAVGARYAVIRTVQVDQDVPPGDLLDFDYAALFLSTEWDRRNNILYPSRGFLIRGFVERAADPYSPDIQFVNANSRATFYATLPWDIVLATSLQGGVILPREETRDIPISLRYFAGGTTTVRGFEFGTIGPRGEDDPTGGEIFMALQTEVRFPIWDRLHGALFTDRGGVWLDHNEVDLDETRYSIGTGLRYYTPAGAITADAAWNPSRDEGEDAVEAHISIGFPF